MSASSGVLRIRVGSVDASVAALDEASIARARELIQRTGSDPAAEEIRRRAGVFLRGAAADPVRVAFLFSGQGSQYPGMMRVLAAEVPAARAVIERADVWALSSSLAPISAWMFSGAVIPTELFAIQATVLCADVMAWAALVDAGVVPAFVTGHSFGDYAALVAAGAWSLETALEATRIRCEAITAASASSEPGGMTSIAAPVDVVRSIVSEASAVGHVEVANTNARDQVVIAGVTRALEVAERLALERKIEAARLPIPRAFHSALMRGAQPVIAARFAYLVIAPPRVPYLSSVTGRVEGEVAAIRASLAAQLTLPVDFVSQVSWLLAQGVNVFLECGPRGVLAGLARRSAPASAVIVTADDAQKPGRWAIARVLAAIDSVTPAAAASAGVSITTPHAGEPDFAEFWTEVKPKVARFVSSLFEREQVVSKPADPRPNVEETMKRHVVRAVVAAPLPLKARFVPKSLAIVGARSARAEAIARAFVERGTEVVFGARTDTEALGFVLDHQPGDAIWSIDQARYRALRDEAITEPFRAARAFQGSTIFAVTALGGALGFENAIQGRPEGGAVLGLLKAIRRELPHLRVQALDASPSEDPQAIAGALLAELDAGSPRLEVGLLRNKRIVLAISERALPDVITKSPLPPTWLITGGARGVTARIALHLATLNQPTLHLIGKHELPPEHELAKLRALDAAELESMKLALPRPTPLAWKAACEAIDKTLEIDKNLRAIAERGSRVYYHAADVADRAALAPILKKARPIFGVIHGSGVEIAKAFDRKTDAIFEATTGAKLDGLVNLLHLMEAGGDAPQTVIGFSSVSGRFGGHGQTDYSLANEAMARVLSSYRAKHPGQRAFAFSWPAFSEVGLAARGSARAFLEQAGQSFMSPDEGAQHLVRELRHGWGEVELVISDRPEHLDQDGACSDRAQRGPGVIIWSKDQERIYERNLIASESFLNQHRMADVPILPAVVALEMMVELAGEQHTVEDFEIRSPIKVPNNGARKIRIAAAGDAFAISASAERSDGVVLDPWRVHVTAERAPARELRLAIALGEKRGAELDYPYGAHLIFHGPMFRVVRSVTPYERGGRAVLVAPEHPERMVLPIELLDGCLQSAGLLGRLLHNVTALPAGLTRLYRPRRALRPGQEISVDIAFTKADATELVCNFIASDDRGVLFAVEGYRATS